VLVAVLFKNHINNLGLFYLSVSGYNFQLDCKAKNIEQHLQFLVDISLIYSIILNIFLKKPFNDI
jgi:hypothetical protein